MADLVVMTASGTTLIFRARVIVRRAAVIEVVCWSSGRPQGDFDQSDRDRAPAGRLRGCRASRRSGPARGIRLAKAANRPRPGEGTSGRRKSAARSEGGSGCHRDRSRPWIVRAPEWRSVGGGFVRKVGAWWSGSTPGDQGKLETFGSGPTSVGLSKSLVTGDRRPRRGALKGLKSRRNTGVTHGTRPGNQHLSGGVVV